MKYKTLLLLITNIGVFNNVFAQSDLEKNITGTIIEASTRICNIIFTK